jgi:hypothetical protein
VDYGVAALEELRGKLMAAPRRRVWVRVLVGPAGDESSALLSLQAVVGPQPPGWLKQTWTYTQCTFASAQITAGRLASLLEPGAPRELVIGRTRALVDMQPGQFSCLHAPSLAQYDELRLDWPCLVYTPSMTGVTVNAPQGYLIGAGDVPSFPVFSGAYAAFFTGIFAVGGTGNPQLGRMSIRWVDTGARIVRVRVHAASLEVWLDGSSLAGTVLELNGVESRAIVPVSKRRVVFELPGGLPSEAWLWLKRGAEWADFRSFGGWGGYRSPDIQVDLPEDPGAEVSRLAAQGEGVHLEYKEKLPDTTSEKRTVFKTIVAFANGAGGTMLFGVSDDGAITGLNGDLAVQRRRLNDLIRSLVTPPPQVRVRQEELDGHGVLIAEVPPGNGTLHALVIDANKPEYYVRRDGTTYYARPEELATIVGKAHMTPRPPFALL